MAVIAVAGGSSPTLGRAIVTAILAGKNTPVILSRATFDFNKQQESYIHGAEVRYIDYTSHESMVDALRDVETVVSVLKIPGPEWVEYQIHLVKAARAAGVKRFAPSEFELGPLATGKVDLTASKAFVWQACEDSGLECARFCTGMFMNYLALGSGRDDLTYGFVDEPAFWDVPNRTAELPIKDDKTFPMISMTDIADIGRFVAAACELPLGSWEPVMAMHGENIRLDEVVRLLEHKSGMEYLVSTVDREELQKRADAIEGFGSDRSEIGTKMMAQISLAVLEDKENVGYLPGTVNKLCPETKPRTVGAFLDALFASS